MLQYSPKIITDSLVMCLDASNNKSYPTTDLPVKGGLVMWLDAADDTTFSYSSGTVVSQWRDKSGLNNHVAQSTVASQPNRNTVKNSRKSVYFDGGDTLFNSGNVFPSNTTNYTKIAVVYQTSTATTGNVIGSRTGYDGSNYGHTIYFGGLNFRMWHDTDIVTSNISLSLNTLGIISATYVNSSGLGSVFLNGTASGTGTAANRNIVQNIEIGGLFGGNNYTGEICEALVFSRVLSATELKQVHTYLGQKWGISNTDRSVFDLSNNNYNGLFGNGTVANMPDYDFYNKGDFKFNGTSDFIQYPSLLNLGNVFTINFWIKPTSNTRQTIVSNGYPYLANKGFFFTCPGNSSTDMFLSLGNDQKQVQSNTGAITTGVVQMVTAVANGAGGLMKLYVNGTEVSYAVQQNADISLQYDSGIFVTGKRDTTTSDYLSSNLYALQIYNKALSTAEVLQNYEAQKSKFANTIVQQGLVLNLDAGNPYSYAGSGATWYDVSGNSFNATLIKTPIYNSDNGGVLNWNGLDQYTTVPMSSTLRVANITQEVWVYLSSTADQVFIGMQYGTGSNNSFALWLSGGAFYFGVNTGGTFYQSSFSTPSVGVWYHLVHTYGGSSQSLYINGSLIGTYSSAATGNITYDVNNTKLAIGADFNGTGYDAGPSLFVNGKMPVVKIYNIALSAAQVLQNYNATKGRFGL
jgi:hypothetical protein